MTIKIEINENDVQLIEDYAKEKNKSVSEIMCTAILDEIKEAAKIEAYVQAITEAKLGPNTPAEKYHEIWAEIDGRRAV